MLDSNDPHIVCLTTKVFANLARHEALSGSVLELDPITRLLSLARCADDPVTQERAIYALCWMVRWSEPAAYAAVAQGVFDAISMLLDSPHPDILAWTCRMLGHIARYDGLHESVLQFAFMQDDHVPVKRCMFCLKLAIGPRQAFVRFWRRISFCMHRHYCNHPTSIACDGRANYWAISRGVCLPVLMMT
ncbi:hypothetical protein B0H17DRAFT_465612 [Mycena rosella]|uniref:Uncharacterized protein n=1 Tax=Mycena rosella TaxID=1033263 RepID=A0AAD7DMP1_MYCRO|nr:hypothetical protein B0H17DRAFT_465612 [Mycena rosella]